MDKLIEVHPEIVSHNVETVRRITKKVRVQAKYDRSLAVLQYLYDKGMNTKSGIMLGLGETEDEVLQAEDVVSAAQEYLAEGMSELLRALSQPESKRHVRRAS